MRIRVLGPIEVEDAGGVLDLGARKPRILLAALALHRGRSVSPSVLAEALWGESPPASHAVTLQGYVADLRKILEPGRAPRTAATVLQTSPAGYRLALPADAFDAVLLESARRDLSAAFPTTADRPWQPTAEIDATAVRATAAALDVALDLWRGEPYADLPDEMVFAERAGLAETRLAAIELREAVRSHLGDAAEAARRLEPVALAHPHRESAWLLLTAALAGAGRQVEALAALRRLRTSLREDLGIDPGPAVTALESAVLRGVHDAGAAPPPVRIVLVDDHPVFRLGMAGLLETLDGIDVVGVAGDAAAARRLVDETVDVVLMDLDLGGESGIDLTAELIARHRDVRVLVMTMHDDDHHVSAALRAGASGYLVKSAGPDEVHRAVRAVARGEFIVGADAARVARSQWSPARPEPS